jgi:hypothetical protein
VCIHFGHPAKKNSLGWSSLWKGTMARLELHGWPWELVGEGREGEGVAGEGERHLLVVGRRKGQSGTMKVLLGERAQSMLLVFSVRCLVVAPEQGRRKERRKKKTKEKKK